MAIDTAIDIIKLALKKGRVLGVGDTLEDSEAQESLDTLNLMLETFSLKKMLVFHETQINFPFVAAQATYTIGPGGMFNHPNRPLKLWSAFTRMQGIDYPMQILTDSTQYDSINNKFIVVSYPASVWYEQTIPLGTLHFYPEPSGGEVYLRFWEQLQSYPTLTTPTVLPVGYKALLVSNLAVNLCADFGIDPSGPLLQWAKDTRAAIKTYNHTTLALTSEAAYVSRTGNNRYNIMSDSYT